ncbi:MAG: 4-hydroxybenzoate octaprenyltransferase [Alphaproteobacteria bacterium]|nr:4-hydroxybenzoate octaprenyltransferase [Alphaproteobacteria bacterium]
MPPEADRFAGRQTDIPVAGWVDRLLPKAARPYARLMRLDRPIGTWLLLFPGWWSIAMAWRGWENAWLFAAFGLGAIIMRGAGCTWNDITDRDFDGRVARTRTRPIPAGEVTVRQAYLFLGLLLLAGLAILLTFNPFAIALGAASLVLVFSYPFMKRITYWPQFVLGLAFNWGALLGWAAVDGALALPPALLYVAGIFWTLGYDTIYAHQDKEDDALIGVKSTALKLGPKTRPFLYQVYAATVLLMAAMGWFIGYGWPFYACLAAGAAQLFWQAHRVALDDPEDCLAKFRSNRLFAWLVLAGMGLEIVLL